MADDCPANTDQGRFDLVSEFMGLPEPLQRAALMVVFAAIDLPTQQLQALRMMLDRLARFPGLPNKSNHYVRMCDNAILSVQIVEQQARMQRLLGGP